jgi:hypothetical protein
MEQAEILMRLAEKEITPDDLADEVLKDLDLLPEILKGISSTNPQVKFGCAKILRTVSKEKPEELYSKMDFFIELLNLDNNIIKWNVIDTIANLTKVDVKNQFDEIFDKFYGMLSDESMVTAAHVIDNSGKIALAKPNLTQKITSELLKIEGIPRNLECTNILLGKAILAFGAFYEQIDNKDEVISFAKRLLNNTRNATKVKAEKFLKKING